MSEHIAITLYASAFETAPIRRGAFDSWEAFCEAFPAVLAHEAASKSDLPYWGPYALAEGETRRDAAVPALSLLVSDLDRCDLTAVLAAIEAQGVAALVYESPSSTPDAPRVRIVCPITRPIAPAECAHTRVAFAEALGLLPGCGADGVPPASIGFYAGRVRGTPARSYWTITGAPANVDALVAAPLAHAWGKRADSVARNPPVAQDAQRVEPACTPRVAALAERMGDRWLDGDREHGNFEKAFYGWLLGRGWSPGEVMALVERLDAEEPDEAKRREHARKARKARTAAPLTGPSDVVREWFGDAWGDVDAHVRRVEKEWTATALATLAHEHAERARARTPQPAPEGPLGRTYLFSDPEEPLDYVCRGLGLATSDGKVSAVAGAAGGGKGPIADHIAVCVAMGAKIFGLYPCERRNVLLLDCEGRRLSMRRMRRLARGMKLDPRELDASLHVKDASQYDWTADYIINAIEDYVREHSIGMIVLDSYTSAMLASGVDAITPEFATLAKTLGALGICVLVVAHSNKASDARGGDPRLGDIAYSGAFAAMMQTAIVVSYPERDDKNLIRVACARAPEGAFAPFQVRWNDAPNDSLEVAVSVPVKIDEQPAAVRANTARAAEAERATADAKRRILAYMSDGAGGAVVRGDLLVIHGGEGKRAGQRALALLVDDGALKALQGGAYALSGPTHADA